jgi:hypothetical protein
MAKTVAGLQRLGIAALHKIDWQFTFVMAALTAPLISRLSVLATKESR